MEKMDLQKIDSEDKNIIVFKFNAE